MFRLTDERGKSRMTLSRVTLNKILFSKAKFKMSRQVYQVQCQSLTLAREYRPHADGWRVCSEDF